MRCGRRRDQWAITIGIEVSVPWFPIISFQPIDLVTPLLVFLWEWRSFKRHWIDEEDIGEVFE